MMMEEAEDMDSDGSRNCLEWEVVRLRQAGKTKSKVLYLEQPRQHKNVHLCYHLLLPLLQPQQQVSLRNDVSREQTLLLLNRVDPLLGFVAMVR